MERNPPPLMTPPRSSSSPTPVAVAAHPERAPFESDVQMGTSARAGTDVHHRALVVKADAAGNGQQRCWRVLSLRKPEGQSVCFIVTHDVLSAPAPRADPGWR